MALIGIIPAFVQLVLGLILAIVYIYIGLSVFTKLTKEIDEEAELKRGNVAIGILMAAVILAIANVIQASMGNFIGLISRNPLNIMLWIVGIVQIFIGIVLAVISIYIAISVIDKITKNIDEIEELRKGNIAVAIMMAIVVIVISFAIQAGVTEISKAVLVIFGGII